jgi:hypothetical protein
VTRSDRAAHHAPDLRTLFDALAVGGDAPLFDLDAWADHFSTRPRLLRSPVGRWFWSALRCEWPPLDPPTPLCIEMTDHVHDYLAGRPSGPWATVFGHILRVTGAMMRLAKGRRVNPEIVYLTGILHDARKLDEWSTGREHEALGAEYAANLLRGELPARAISEIRQAIDIHPERPPLSWTVARLLHDADKLDKVGATGLLRRLTIAEDHDEACVGAERTLDDAEDLPTPALDATYALLAPKLAFTATLGDLLDGVCDEWEG